MNNNDTVSNLEYGIQAGTRFISSEMQDIFERVYFLIPNWKWIFLIGGLIAIRLLRYTIRLFLKKIKNADKYFSDKSFMQFFFDLEIENAFSWIISSILAMILVESLVLTPNLDKYLTLFFKLVLSTNIIRVCYLAAEAFGSSIQEWAKTTDTQIDDQLAPLATKSLKVLVVIVGVLIVLQNLGQNVTALLAGLGIGGVALAFAAQDTVANVFGTITILLDTPFKLGDKIKIADTEGTVEEVGFRSTRIRTYYNSVISIPNSVVAKEKIDNMTERGGWVRFRNVLGVTYDANPQLINQFIENFKYQLLQDATVDRERISITLNGFGDSSLNILVIFHYKILPTEDELLRNQIYLEQIYQLMKQHNLDFAYPTHVVITQNK